MCVQDYETIYSNFLRAKPIFTNSTTSATMRYYINSTQHLFNNNVTKIRTSSVIEVLSLQQYLGHNSDNTI